MNGLETGFASTWIAIQGTGPTIIQAGFIHIWDTGLSASRYCTFWATGGGATHLDPDTCDYLSQDQYIRWQILKYWDPVAHVYKYEIERCDAGNYTNCSVRNDSQTQVSNEFAFAAAETDYGGTPCTVHIMGSSLDHANIGTSNTPIEIMANYGGVFQAKTMSGTSATCGDYVAVFHTSYFGMYDDRN